MDPFGSYISVAGGLLGIGQCLAAFRLRPRTSLVTYVSGFPVSYLLLFAGAQVFDATLWPPADSGWPPGKLYHASLSPAVVWANVGGAATGLGWLLRYCWIRWDAWGAALGRLTARRRKGG